MACSMPCQWCHYLGVSTLTSLGTPYDITLQELGIEAFFPADEGTEDTAPRLAKG
jgi:hypothetical protein